MPRKRLMAIVATVGVAIAGAAAALLPITASEAAAACATAYNNSTVYTGGAVVSYNSHNWTAKWWTQYETPSHRRLRRLGRQRRLRRRRHRRRRRHGACNYPNWVAGQYYATGAIVRYTNGLYYQATHDNPGYDPTISTWFWSPYTCTGGGGTTPPAAAAPAASWSARPSSTRCSRAGTASTPTPGLIDRDEEVPGVRHHRQRHGQASRRRPRSWPTSATRPAAWSTSTRSTSQLADYCDTVQPYGCPAGQSAYHGRGPIQLSWNFNYNAAGNALGVDLLDNPNLVATNASISWQTGLWYWMTGTGNAGTTSHNAMVNGQGFGTTIRAINSIECNGGNTAEMQDRVNLYNRSPASSASPPAAT